MKEEPETEMIMMKPADKEAKAKEVSVDAEEPRGREKERKKGRLSRTFTGDSTWECCSYQFIHSITSTSGLVYTSI